MEHKLKTFVLRRNLAGAPSIGTGVLGAEPIASTESAQPFKLQTLDTVQGERAELATEDDAISVGLTIPFTVIQPLEVIGADNGDDNWGIAAIGAEGIGQTAGQDVKVAVLDTGIAQDHPAFDGVDPITENFTDDVPADISGHGTHCASTIFGQDVDGRRIGVARGVRKPLIGKVLGEGGGDSESILEGMLWARRNGARVVSMSLGMDFTQFRQTLVAYGYHELEATSVALQGYRDNLRLFDQISVLFGDATVINTPMLIAAAGNESRRPEYEIATAPPAAADDILSVGAMTKDRGVARFSNTNPDCIAPGVEILGAKHTGGLVRLSGTSMAAPHVAGVAVLEAEKLAHSPPFTANDLAIAVLARAQDIPSLTRAEQGRGLIMA